MVAKPTEVTGSKCLKVGKLAIFNLARAIIGWIFVKAYDELQTIRCCSSLIVAGVSARSWIECPWSIFGSRAGGMLIGTLWFQAAAHMVSLRFKRCPLPDGKRAQL